VGRRKGVDKPFLLWNGEEKSLTRKGGTRLGYLQREKRKVHCPGSSTACYQRGGKEKVKSVRIALSIDEPNRI